jgi:predicted Rossmann fold nucleotide-binding protein DprA/Smf involved in DNA uptake
MDSGLDPDAETTLLLCGRFGKSEETGVAPLELREYSAVDAWLKENGQSQADLLEVSERAAEDSTFPIDPERIRRLLSRGSALALSVESWESKGIWVISRAQEEYPARLKDLGRHAPALLFGCGDAQALSNEGQSLAVVGSRHANEAALEISRESGRRCAENGITVVSGAARGVDSQAMGAALERGGRAIGVLADRLSRAAVEPQHREALLEGNLVLLSPYDPDAGFNVGNAMGRNKCVYAFADVALVVSASAESGGTRAGALEALKRGKPPVFVWADEEAPDGNHRLLKEGAKAFPELAFDDFPAWIVAASKAHDVESIEVEFQTDAGEVVQGKLI